MGRFLLGILFGCGGVAMIYFANGMQKAFGKIDWMERSLGSTVTGYQIIGFILIIVGFLYMFGIMN